MAARNNYQASKKGTATLRVLNTVNFIRFRYLLLIKITNIAINKHTDKSYIASFKLKNTI